MSKSKFASLVCLAILLSLSQANAQSVLGVTPKVKAVLIDKDSNKYEFRLLYDLKHGLATITYDFGTEEDRKVIFKGKTFGDGERCPDRNVTDITLEKAILKHVYTKNDFNNDGINDLNLSIAEKDCKTGGVVFIEKLLLSTPTGFELKTFEQGDIK